MKTFSSEELAKELRKAGIKAKAYKRSPVSGANFIVSLTPGGKELFVYSKKGKAKFDLRLSKKHKQAVIYAEEEKRVLRPDNVPAGSKRQGEFFFVPITLSQTDINNINEVYNINARYPSSSGNNLEKDSTHFAQQMMVFKKGTKFANKVIVKGKIRDERKDRHAPLLLTKWHEVIRNNEVVIPFEEALKNRYWD